MDARAVLNDEWIHEAEKLGISRDLAEREFDQFRDHWLAASGAKAAKRDWLAAWRTWCRNAIDWQRPAKTRGRISAADITTGRDPLFGETSR